MIYSRRQYFRLLSGALGASITARATAGDSSDEEKEKFLRLGKIISASEIGHGVTKPLKAELEHEGAKHAAQIQVVNKALPDFFSEDNQRFPSLDCWRFNVAAYQIDRLVKLNMVAVTVPRTYQGKPGAICWWVDDVLFEEADRVKKGVNPPDAEDWDRQRALSQVFDELILNIDRNLANMLITKSWKMALIDHTRAFAPYPGIRNKANLRRCSRDLLARISALTPEGVKNAVGSNLTDKEVQAVVARGAKIAEFFQQEIKSKGEGSVLFS